MLPIPNEAPKSLEEYNYLIDATYQNGLEQYEIDRAKAQEKAERQWEAQYLTIRERLIAQMEGNLAATIVDSPEKPRQLSDAEWQLKWNENIKEVDARLAQEERQYIDLAISMVRLPQTIKEIEDLYSCYKDTWVQTDIPDSPYLPVTLEEAKLAKIKEVNAQISENIKAGFDFAFNGEKPLYYTLTKWDQINLANYANLAIILIQSGADDKIDLQAWNSPDPANDDMPVIIALTPEDFITLYRQGALAHIQKCLSEGRAVKYQILAAITKEEVASLKVEPTQIVKAKNG